MDKGVASAQTLQVLMEFLCSYGCPTVIHSDHANNLCKADSWKCLSALCLIKPHMNEPNKSQSNHVEHAWQELQE